jgi:hypothetical protein
MEALVSICPHLPAAESMRDASALAAHGASRDEGFYLTALEYAQCLWQQGLPARALLLINRAMGCDLTGASAILGRHPMPYAAVAWILTHHEAAHFIGNPRRHWQHLATRMAGPRPEIRTWRAWACWALARRILPHCPADEIQLAREPIAEPLVGGILEKLAALGLPHEAALWHQIWTEATPRAEDGGGAAY